MRSALTAAAVVAIAAGSVSAAHAAPADEGNNALAGVLLADGDTFDHNWHDYDIVTQAVLAVLEAKPDSAVGVLTDGDVALTAFIPRDGAFAQLVWDLTGKAVWNEEKVFEAVASLGIDTVEEVLLYHVVPGATIPASDALEAEGAELTTAQGGSITVNVISKHFGWISLKDNDTNDFDPFVVQTDINVGNKQIAHGISRVLRPADLDG